MRLGAFASQVHAAALFAFAGNAAATTIISDLSVDYPRLTAFATGGAFQEDLSAADANTGSLTAVSVDGRNPPPKINSAVASIDRQLGGFGVQAVHATTLSTALASGSVKASVTDRFSIQTDTGVPFSFQAHVQASLAPSLAIGREVSFMLSNQETGEMLYSYRWLWANEAIWGLPNPTLSPSFSTILDPGTYRFDAYLFDATSNFGQGAITTGFDYTFSVPEPSSAAMLGFATLGVLMVRRVRSLAQ